MLPYNRPEEPQCLADNALAWTTAFVARRSKDPKASFSWNNQDCYAIVRETLFEPTGNRCAFCDGMTGSVSRQTVEHFKPKKTFPELAFTWSNLFPCCDMRPLRNTLRRVSAPPRRRILRSNFCFSALICLYLPLEWANCRTPGAPLPPIWPWPSIFSG